MLTVKCPKHSPDITKGLICFRENEMQQVADHGDSGGPITCEVGGRKEVVVGVLSSSCGKSGKKSRKKSSQTKRCSATDVRKIHEWVEKHTNPKVPAEKSPKPKVPLEIISLIISIFVAAVVFYYSR